MGAASITLLLSTVLGILSTACGQDNETAEAPDFCYVVEATETCADLTNGYWNVASTIELNGVNAIQCCKDPSAVMNMDGGWCTGSAGSSEEATAPSNPFTEVSSNSSVVESHTEEHSESRTEESHTETSTTTTTTTTDGAASSTTCNIASGLCICTGTCPAETSTWGNVMDDDGICIALKDGALQVVKGSGQIVNNTMGMVYK